MADITIIMRPIFANLVTREFADRVFYLRATEHGEFFVEEHSTGPLNMNITQIGKKPKGEVAEEYINVMKTNNVTILDYASTKDEIIKSIDLICLQHNIPLI